MKFATPRDLLAEMRRRDGATEASFKVPERFVDFCEWIAVTLTPAQRVYCMVAYDWVQPCELAGDDRAMAHILFGDVDVFLDDARTEVWTLAGGRAGKTYILGALRLVWGAFVRDLSSLAPGQKAVALSCAPKDVHRQEIVNYQLGAIWSRPELAASIVAPRGLKPGDSPESFVVRRPDGALVTFEGGTANAGGYGGRGRALTDFLGDEAAFFRAQGVVNDKEIFKAASPRVLPGGQLIGQTTAWAEIGYHFEQWSKNFGHPITAIAARATTEVLRPDASPMVVRERQKDPDNAKREFDAVPLGDAPEIFFSPALIGLCLDSTMAFPLAPVAGDDAHPEQKAAGADFGFRSNSSAIAITHRGGEEIQLANLRELRPLDGVPLKPSNTVKAFAGMCQDHGVHFVVADGHYKESVKEHLGLIGFSDADANPGEVFVRARMLMREGRVRIPDPDAMPDGAEKVALERLVKQMKDVRGTPQAGGTYSIKLPLWPDGSHGDLVAAFVLSLYRFGAESDKQAAPILGTPEWEEAERAKRRAALRAGNRRASGIRH